MKYITASAALQLARKAQADLPGALFTRCQECIEQAALDGSTQCEARFNIEFTDALALELEQRLSRDGYSFLVSLINRVGEMLSDKDRYSFTYHIYWNGRRVQEGYAKQKAAGMLR